MTARVLERALRGALGDPHRSVLNTRAIDGGCINHAYEEASPLPAGWLERNPLYQLYHLSITRCCSAAVMPMKRRMASRFVGG